MVKISSQSDKRLQRKTLKFSADKQRQTDRQTRRRHHAEHDTCKIHKTNLTSKIIGGWIQWPNMQLLFKFQDNRMKIEDFRNLTQVVDLWPMLIFWCMMTLKNNWLVEFSDLKYKSSSNFKSIRWKLRILEPSPRLLTFGLKYNRLLPYDKVFHVVKFCEDRFKIVTCRW